MNYTYRITEINREESKISIMFCEDPNMHWSYEIPVDENGKALTGDLFRAWCAEQIFPLIEKLEKPKPDLTTFVMLEVKSTPTDISKEIKEIKQLKAMLEDGS